MSDRRQEMPENLSADGTYVRVYGTTYYGRRYMNHRKKLSAGEIEYLAQLAERRVKHEERRCSVCEEMFTPV